jgi:hypothetical protein
VVGRDTQTKEAIRELDLDAELEQLKKRLSTEE